jgi:hypothetical protein
MATYITMPGGLEDTMRTPVKTEVANNANLPIVDGIATAPPRCPGAQIEDQDDLVDHFAVAIHEAWQKCSRAILEPATQCAEANQVLEPVPCDRLLEKRSFRPTFKLASIGWKTALYDLEIEELLQPDWKLLRELRNLDADELDQPIEQGIVWPYSRRTEILKWVSNPRNCKRVTETRVTRVAILASHNEDISFLEEARGASRDLVRLRGQTSARIRCASPERP